MDVFHTGNYVRSHYNFKVSGLAGSPQFSAVSATLFNILFRGSPSTPSQFLKEQLAKKDITYPQKASIHLDLQHVPCWENTIKGAVSGYNPALNFYNEQLPKLLGPYKFTHTLIRPEVLITDIVKTAAAQTFLAEAVDFFLPSANLVIEVDGPQHQDLPNRQKDKQRDDLFRHHGIKVLRITTHGLRNEETLLTFSGALINHLSKSDMVETYRRATVAKAPQANLIYSTIFRIQAVLIEMLGRKMISFDDKDWNITITSEIDPTFSKLAITDLFNWAKIINSEINLPLIELNNIEPEHVIDVSISTRWDETSCDDNSVITCKTDHFDYFPESAPRNATTQDYFCANYAASAVSLDFDRLGLKASLFEIFGYETFQPGQIDIIENIFQGADTIGILPTGGGKSLCYQLPAILSSGLTLVVCPIKSLMRDQVEELRRIGFHRAAAIDSDTSVKDKERILTAVSMGALRFLFVSPERLQVKSFRATIEDLNVRNPLARVVIDEVHCMSEWGHDFRTAYLTLPNTIKAILPTTPKLCLTATASTRVLDDIKTEFDIDANDVKTLALYRRENLNFAVLDCQPFEEVHKILREKLATNTLNNSQASIIFTSFVNGESGAHPLYQSIKKYITDANIFTGSKPKKHATKNYEQEKAATQKGFKDNKFPLLVATKAFGMGVNKTNVRSTVHTGLPGSIEALYQEAGRAGRDRKKADCKVLFQRPSAQAQKLFFGYKDYQEFSALSLGPDGGDLNQHHYFLKLTIKDNYAVPSVIEKILRQITTKDYGKDQIASAKLKTTPAITQLALYRLFQMGLVTDWTVVDFLKGIYHVDSKIMHIQYYNQRVYKLTGQCIDETVVAQTESLEDWFVAMHQLARILVEYHLNTRVKNRIESVKTLLEACLRFDPTAPQTFREELESYFTIDSINDSLGDIVSDKTEPARILSYLNSTHGGIPLLQQTKSSIAKRKIALRRYIESYPDNIGLALLDTLFDVHLTGENTEILQHILFEYREILKSDKVFFSFLKDLKDICAATAWTKVEDSVANNLSQPLDLDKFASEFNNTLAVTKLLSFLQPEITKQTGKVYELI